jgi:hypothetical protein
MSLNGYIALCLGVLSDWRVIAVALGSLVLWSILRYVGMVYYRRAPFRPPAGPKGGGAPEAEERRPAS